MESRFIPGDGLSSAVLGIKNQALHIIIDKVSNILNKLEDTDDCILWYKKIYGGKYKKGYPFLGIRLGGRGGKYFDFKVSRIICHIEYSMDLNNRYILALHKCNNKRCINKKHIRPGTNQENMNDLVKTGLLNRPRPNARKSYCKCGHELTQDNVYYSGDARCCKKCKLVCSEKIWRLNKILKVEITTRKMKNYKLIGKEDI